MPPRISDFPCLQALKSALPSANGRQIAPAPLRTFTSSTSHQANAAKTSKQRRYRDPYVAAQVRARKAANISKQASLNLTRARDMGDPVRGVETDFVRSFDTARDVEPSGKKQKGLKDVEQKADLNHLLTQEEVDAQLEKSKRLVEPIARTERELQHDVGSKAPGMNGEQVLVDYKHAQDVQQWAAAHETVEEAVRRITSIENGSAKDRFRINVERCIRTFGRHETDGVLPPRPTSIPLGPGGAIRLNAVPDVAPMKERLGPDTGSSEVQIAILTAKIRNLAGHMERVGNKDKMNKRNLRLLVHRRQKLLQYLRRKERGGPRWQKCISMLGLTEGTWKGEITL